MDERWDMRNDGNGEAAGPRLSAEDGAAVDAVMEGREGTGEREARVRELLGALDRLPAEQAPGDLASRTMAAIRADRVAAVREPAAAAGRRRWRIGWKEAAAMATAAAILVAVLIPAMAQARESARRVACAANMAVYSQAFGTYAAANGGMLPTLGVPANGNWLDDGKGRTNADNVLPLVSGGYLTADRLACPGRGTGVVLPAGATHIPDAGRGYSYTNVVAEGGQRWGSAATLVLADRNPLFDPAAGGNATMESNSCNHGGHGTYVLAGDGSAVAWDATPNVGPKGDNIWTLGSGQATRVVYGGTEKGGAGDAFLAP